MPPSVDNSQTQQTVSIFINKAKADPPPQLIVKFANTSEQFLTFDLTNAVQALGFDPLNLRYFWYYDYDPVPGRTLDTFIVCATSGQHCLVAPCNHEGATAGSHHRVTVVVSDLPLRVTDDVNQGPFDFPKGAHFDSVQWDVEQKGNCP